MKTDCFFGKTKPSCCRKLIFVWFAQIGPVFLKRKTATVTIFQCWNDTMLLDVHQRFARLRDAPSIAAFAVRHGPIQPPVWPQQSTGEEILAHTQHTQAEERKSR
jgi:hypothetical protein